MKTHIKREEHTMNYSKSELEKMMIENNGNLDISKMDITELPNELTVKGDLILNQYIRQLPDDLRVEGNLDLSNTYADFNDTKGFYVGGDLITGPMTRCINEPFGAGGNIDMRASPYLKKLPEVCMAVKDIFINSKYIKLDQSTAIDCRNLHLENSGIYELPDSVMCDLDINLSHSGIQKFPANYLVWGDLDLSYTKLTDYPDNLTVHGNLDIRGTTLPSQSDKLSVYGNVISDDGIFPYENGFEVPMRFRKFIKWYHEYFSEN